MTEGPYQCARSGYAVTSRDLDAGLSFHHTMLDTRGDLRLLAATLNKELKMPSETWAVARVFCGSGPLLISRYWREEEKTSSTTRSRPARLLW